jgi:mono/diheme cytochrome c family protein
MMRYARTTLCAALLTLGTATAAHAQMSLPTLYMLHCSGCHGATGHGVPERGIPDLHNAGSYVALPQGRAYLVQVPGISQSRLDDATAARILNYVLARFSATELPADFKPYTADEVTRLRADKASDAETRRAQIIDGLRKQGKLPADYNAAEPAH